MKDDFYRRALQRIRWWAALAALAGATAWAAGQGFRPAAGFLLGSSISALNFRGIEMLAGALGSSKRPRAFAALLMVFRYALAGGALYVIVRILGFTPLPVLAGLLVPFGAVVLEILYELISRVHE
jgi:ATP synthase I chain